MTHINFRLLFVAYIQTFLFILAYGTYPFDAFISTLLVETVEVSLHGGHQMLSLQFCLYLLVDVKLKLISLFVLLHKYKIISGHTYDASPISTTTFSAPSINFPSSSSLPPYDSL